MLTYPAYLSGRADDHAVIVSNNTVKLLHGQFVLHVRLVTPLLEYVHANLHSITSHMHGKGECDRDATFIVWAIE